MYVCVYVCVRACLRACVHLCTFMYIYVHVCICVYMCVSICMCYYVCSYIPHCITIAVRSSCNSTCNIVTQSTHPTFPMSKKSKLSANHSQRKLEEMIPKLCVQFREIDSQEFVGNRPFQMRLYFPIAKSM